MTRHAKRVDANHALIRDGLRGMGHDVTDTSKNGNGFPDLTVRFGGLLPVLLEIKDPAKPKSARALTEAELAFFEVFAPICYVVTTLDEALIAIGAAKILQSGWK